MFATARSRGSRCADSMIAKAPKPTACGRNCSWCCRRPNSGKLAPYGQQKHPGDKARFRGVPIWEGLRFREALFVLSTASFPKTMPRAPVKPRLVSSATGAALPVEDEVRVLLNQREPATIRLCGGPGSGKTTCLRHLAAVFPHAATLCLVDETDLIQGKAALESIVVGVWEGLAGSWVRFFNLAPWDRDELIEYLLAAHPRECAAVIARVSAGDLSEFGGIPEIWRVVLDELAADVALSDPAAALIHHLRARTPRELIWKQLAAACIRLETASLAALPPALSCELRPEVDRLLRHRPVRRLLAAERLCRRLVHTSP